MTVGLALLAVFAVVDDLPEVVTSLAAVTMGLATLVSLLVLGAACRRTLGLPAPWGRLPWVMGVALLPSMTVIGGLLAAIHERLLELPVVAYGVGWAILGYAMLATVGHTHGQKRGSGSPVAGQTAGGECPGVGGAIPVVTTAGAPEGGHAVRMSFDG